MPAAQKPAEPLPPAAMDPAPHEETTVPPEWSPRSGSNSPAPRRGAGDTFAEETVDYGVPPTNTLHWRFRRSHTHAYRWRAHDHDGRAAEHGGIRQPPVLIDVIGGEQTVSLPTRSGCVTPESAAIWTTTCRPGSTCICRN